VKKILTDIMAVVLVLAAGTGITYAYVNYKDCRCSQPTPGSGVNIVNDCCYNNYGGYGNDGDARCCTSPKTWVKANKGCYTPCSSVTCSGTTPTKNGQTYQETTGTCCMAASKTSCPSTTKCLPGFKVNTSGYVEDGNCCTCATNYVGSSCCSDPTYFNQTGVASPGCVACTNSAGHCCASSATNALQCASI